MAIMLGNLSEEEIEYRLNISLSTEDKKTLNEEALAAILAVSGCPENELLYSLGENPNFDSCCPSPSKEISLRDCMECWTAWLRQEAT